MDGYVKGYANVNVGPGPQSQYFQPVPIEVIGDAARTEPPPLMQVPIHGWQSGGSLDTGGADTGAKDEAKKETSYGKYILGALGVAGVIGIGYVLASDKYSKNPVDGPLEMPETLNVLDQHGGFSAWITTKKSGDYTLWRPGQVLKSPVGTLIAGSVNPKSFYQLNNDVTKAMYKVRGYRYPVVVWFDNKTGKRIA